MLIIVKKLATVCTIIALCAGYALSADNGETKKAPPGLQKKDGVPPGQAKKKGQAGSDGTSSATAAPAPAPAATAPAAATATAAAPAPAPAVAKAEAAPAKAVAPAEPKATLESNRLAINQATQSNPAMHKVALQHISKETGVSLEHLREQDKNFPEASDTGLLLGNVIAKKANVKFGDVIHARQNGKQWHEIAKAHNVDVGLLVQKSSQLVQTLRDSGAR